MIENMDQKFKKKKNKNFRLTQSQVEQTQIKKRPEEEKELKTGRNGQAERRRKGEESSGHRWRRLGNHLKGTLILHQS